MLFAKFFSAASLTETAEATQADVGMQPLQVAPAQRQQQQQGQRLAKRHGLLWGSAVLIASVLAGCASRAPAPSPTPPVAGSPITREKSRWLPVPSPSKKTPKPSKRLS